MTAILLACITVPVTDDDVALMLPACVTVPAAGDNMTTVFPASWLCVTDPELLMMLR